MFSIFNFSIFLVLFIFGHGESIKDWEALNEFHIPYGRGSLMELGLRLYHIKLCKYEQDPYRKKSYPQIFSSKPAHQKWQISKVKIAKIWLDYWPVSCMITINIV